VQNVAWKEEAVARKKQSKIGRPPKREGERLSKNRTFRVRGTLDEQLAAAAQEAGRSVSEEIEYRLENSFREDDRYGGPHLSAVFRLVADYKALAGARPGEGDRIRGGIAQVFSELLAELPGFHSVTIETVGQHGEISGVTGYASDEARNRDHPGIAEILRARRAAAAPRGEQPATDKREDPK
jgi:hypothetical protein